MQWTPKQFQKVNCKAHVRAFHHLTHFHQLLTSKPIYGLDKQGHNIFYSVSNLCQGCQLLLYELTYESPAKYTEVSKSKGLLSRYIRFHS